MGAKLAYLFPGQGSQKVGMGKDLAENFPAAAAVFAQADEALGFALSRLCREGPEEELRLTINTQPAILTTSIAAVRAIEGELGVEPALAAGHSLGEYSALVAAGALDFTDAVRAVRERGRLMQAACPPGQGAMAALIGLDLAVVSEICRASSDGEIVSPANLNAPGQIVIAGHSGAVRRAVAMARERGSKMSVELNVSAPFHCALMEPAREPMRAVLEPLAIGAMRCGVIANVTAQINRNPARVVPLLLDQITSPVRWEESMSTLIAAGPKLGAEPGAGRVLTTLMRRISKDFKVYPVEDKASVASLGAALGPGV